jgi:23S rRNA (adenine2503-C2)-methyltransferase
MELLGKLKEELREFCAAMGEPAYRGEQIYHALYAERKFDFVQMTNLPAAFRERLAKEATITLPKIRHRFASADGSVRYLFELGGAETTARANLNTEFTEDVVDMEGTEKAGTKRKRVNAIEKPRLAVNRSFAAAPPRAAVAFRPAAVEAVFMPSKGRQTICVSTQAGCAVNCQFCLTAQLGLVRNLTAGDILAQVLLPLEENRRARAAAGAEGVGKDAGATRDSRQDSIQTNVVLMGQGEPLLNFDAVMAALRILLDPDGVGLSPKHVTLSTSGIVPGIERLAQEKVRPKLAISLNASNDEEREVLMPINKKYRLRVLLAACKKYPLRPWEHLTFEYVMLGGVNDAPEDARRVVRLLAPLKSVKVNLIPWNPGELPYRESSPERIEEFRRILTEKGVPAFVRYSRGRDVMAACGQLALIQIDGASAAIPMADQLA